MYRLWKEDPKSVNRYWNVYFSGLDIKHSNHRPQITIHIQQMVLRHYTSDRVRNSMSI